MPNTIKYSTSGDTQSLRKGNFYIGVGDVPKGPSNVTGHWQGITPPTSGYTIYIDGGVGGVRIMAPDSDDKLVAYANGMNNNTNYVSNGGNFTNGTISPFNSLYNQAYGASYVVNIANDKPYSGSNSNYAMFFNYGGGRMMGTDGMLTTGVTYTFSFWAKLLSGTTMTVSWNNQNGSGETNAWTSSATLTTEWKRYIQTFTYNLPRTRFYFYTANPSNPERAAIFTEFQVSTGTTYGGPGLQNAAEALNWFASVSQDEVCVNRDYEPIITNGLILNLDAGYTPSYPRTGTTWYDLAYSGNNGTLTNGPTYNSSNGGSIVFDGVDDYITIPDSLAPTPAVTMIFWINKSFTNYYLSIHSRNNNALNGNHTGIGYGTPISNGGWIQIGYMGDGTNNYFIINGTIYSGNDGSQFPYDSANSIVMFSMNNNGYFSGNNAPVTSLALTPSLSNYSGYQWLNRNYKTLGILSTSANRRPFNGQMSNSLFYNRVLSSQEVLQNYNALKGRYGL